MQWAMRLITLHVNCTTHAHGISFYRLFSFIISYIYFVHRISKSRSMWDQLAHKELRDVFQAVNKNKIEDSLDVE